MLNGLADAFYHPLLLGNFAALPALHHLVESTRRSSSEAIYTTAIRNEHAYYQCIIQVLAEREIFVSTDRVASRKTSTALAFVDEANPVEIVKKVTSNPVPKGTGGAFCEKSWSKKLCVDGDLIAQASRRPIYVVGDSHCISPAWSILHFKDSHYDTTIKAGTSMKVDGSMQCDDSSLDNMNTINKEKGSPRLLVPKLVTGIKQWHLRPQANFYTKASFQETMAGIPQESDVSCSLECRWLLFILPISAHNPIGIQSSI